MGPGKPAPTPHPAILRTGKAPAVLRSCAGLRQLRDDHAPSEPQHRGPPSRVRRSSPRAAARGGPTCAAGARSGVLTSVDRPPPHSTEAATVVATPVRVSRITSGEAVLWSYPQWSPDGDGSHLAGSLSSEEQRMIRRSSTWRTNGSESLSAPRMSLAGAGSHAIASSTTASRRLIRSATSVPTRQCSPSPLATPFRTSCTGTHGSEDERLDRRARFTRGTNPEPDPCRTDVSETR
jgi:hypothetical protein